MGGRQRTSLFMVKEEEQGKKQRGRERGKAKQKK